MATLGVSFPALPSSPGAQGPQAPPQAPLPAGSNPLLGNSGNLPPSGPTPDQQVSAYMDQVRNLSIQIDALALDHPEASDDLNQAKQALANSMSKVASALTQPQNSPQPPTF